MGPKKRASYQGVNERGNRKVPLGFRKAFRKAFRKFTRSVPEVPETRRHSPFPPPFSRRKHVQLGRWALCLAVPVWASALACPFLGTLEIF